MQKIPENWRPDENIVQKLKLQRIEEKFIENVDEFVLYWREKIKLRILGVVNSCNISQDAGRKVKFIIIQLS